MAVMLWTACLCSQAGAVLIVHHIRPRYLVDPMTRAVEHVESPADRAAELERRLKARARQMTLVQAINFVRKTVAVTGFWLAVGLLVGRGLSGWAVFGSVAVAGVVSTLEVAVRHVAALWLNGDPGPLTLAGLVAGKPVWASTLGRIEVFKIWWALAAGTGFATAWKRPIAAVQVITVTVTLCWMWFTWHPH
jgi:hypothetical protein